MVSSLLNAIESVGTFTLRDPPWLYPSPTPPEKRGFFAWTFYLMVVKLTTYLVYPSALP